MTDRTSDFSQLYALADDFDQAADDIGPNLRSAIGRTSYRVRDDWRENLSGLLHLPQLPSKISFDITATPGLPMSQIRSDIGPVNEGQGSLGGKTEFGSVNNPPRGDGHAALQRNEEDFHRGIDIAVNDAMNKAGL